MCVHPTAILEPGVVLGAGTSVWDNVHIRRDTVLGDDCIVGEKTHIAYGVRIGHRVKINSFVYICTAVTIEDGAMISAGTIFTNDRFPRATTPDLKQLRPSDPDEHTLPTLVKEGATIGAGCGAGVGSRTRRLGCAGARDRRRSGFDWGHHLTAAAREHRRPHGLLRRVAAHRRRTVEAGRVGKSPEG